MYPYNYYPQNQQMNGPLNYQITRSKKARLKWNPTLHKCFLDAVHHLGGGIRAKPRNLIGAMNVPGLNLHQIKSHLQKYRLGAKVMKQRKQLGEKREKKTYNLRSQRSSPTSSTASSGKKVASEYFSGIATAKTEYERQPSEEKAEQLMPKSQTQEPTLSSDDLDEAFKIISDMDIATLMADITFGDEELPPPSPTSFSAISFCQPSPIMTEANKVDTHFEQAITNCNPNISYVDDYLIDLEPVLSPVVGVKGDSGNLVENGGDFSSYHVDLDEVHRFFDEMGW